MPVEKYDNLEMHYLNVEADIDQRQYGVPTGQYLAWLIRRGWVSEELNAHAGDLELGLTTGCDVLWDMCDGQLLADDLTEEGNRFTEQYFEEHYFKDYLALFSLDPSQPAALYQPANTRDNFARVSRMLDARYRARTHSTSMPTIEDLHRYWLDVALKHLHSDGFGISEDGKWSARYHCTELKKRFPGGQHALLLGTYFDRKRGHHGFFADLHSTQDRVALALRNAYAPEERARMSMVDERFIPLRLPMHSWVKHHPKLIEVQEGDDQFEWLGRRRVVVGIEHIDDISNAARAMLELLDRDLLPKLPRFESPSGLAEIKCQLPLRENTAVINAYDRGVLVIAELARIPHLNALCDSMTEWLLDENPRLTMADRLMLAFIDGVRIAHQAK